MHTLPVIARPSGKANALRREGFVPAVIYGPSIESKVIAISKKDLKALFSVITRSSRINLAIDGARDVDVFLKAVDYHSITDEPIHVDFYHPEVDHPLKLHVPVKVVGEPVGVKTGGILNVLFNTVLVHGLPKDIPNLITIDATDLDLGDSIYVRDIDLGDVEPMLPPERALVTVISPRGLLAEEVEEAEEAEEGELVEGQLAEGEEAAEGDAEAGSSEGE